MKRIIIVVLIFLSVFAVNAQSIDYLGKARKYYSEGNCEGAKTYLDLYVELGGTVDKVVRDFSAEVDKCLKDKDKGSSDSIVCTFSIRTVYAQGGHEYVDLGLSVKWATCNVGASKPEDYGNYYAWGETSTKSSYTRNNSKTNEENIGDIKGNSNYDAARANWGGKWRMPTKAEMQELIDRCTWTWTTQNGVKGHKVTGPNGNSIFLPAAGYRSGSSLNDAGSDGGYWSSSPFEGYVSLGGAWYLGFNSGDIPMYGSRRYDGRSVRPVLE